MIDLNLNVVAERVRQEIKERVLQGYDVDGSLQRWEAARGDRQALLELSLQLTELPLQPGWPYHEPSDLEGIRQSRGAAISLPPFYLLEEEVRHKIHGAWLGRVAGCILGKPPAPGRLHPGPITR